MSSGLSVGDIVQYVGKPNKSIPGLTKKYVGKVTFMCLSGKVRVDKLREYDDASFVLTSNDGQKLETYHESGFKDINDLFSFVYGD